MKDDNALVLVLAGSVVQCRSFSVSGVAFFRVIVSSLIPNLI
jgi:hypothetical protein